MQFAAFMSSLCSCCMLPFRRKISRASFLPPALLLLLASLAHVLGQPQSITLGCQLFISADLETVRGGPGEARTAFQLAIDEINASADLLPDTVLLPMYRNTYGREATVQDTLDLVQHYGNETVRPQIRVRAAAGPSMREAQSLHLATGFCRVTLACIEWLLCNPLA